MTVFKALKHKLIGEEGEKKRKRRRELAARFEKHCEGIIAISPQYKKKYPRTLLFKHGKEYLSRDVVVGVTLIP